MMINSEIGDEMKNQKTIRLKIKIPSSQTECNGHWKLNSKDPTGRLLTFQH